ncbi:MAG: PKD domain-containing protein [Nanoarchaeota archaeon]
MKWNMKQKQTMLWTAVLLVAISVIAIEMADIVMDINGITIFTRNEKLSDPVVVSNFANAVNAYLENCTPDADGMCKVPIHVQTKWPLRLENLEVYYTLKNDSYLNLTPNNSSQNDSSSNNITIPKENKAPTSRFTTSVENGTAPLHVRFDASGSSDQDGSIVNYSWKLGMLINNSQEVAQARGQVVEYTYEKPGRYEVILSVTDDAGATTDFTKYVTVIEAPNNPPIAELKASAMSGKAPLLVEFDASQSRDSDGRVEVFAWDFGDGEKSIGSRVTHTFSKPGTFRVYLGILDDKNASGTDFEDIVVQQNNPPTVHRISQTRFRRFSPAAFYVFATDPDNDPLTYRINSNKVQIERALFHTNQQGQSVPGNQLGNGFFTTNGKPFPTGVCMSDTITVYASDGAVDAVTYATIVVC